MDHDEHLILGVVSLGLALLCFTWLKENVSSLFGLITINWKNLGWILAVVGGINLLLGIDKLSDLLYLPLALIGWLLEHWYITVVVIAAVILFRNGGISLPELGKDKQADSQVQQYEMDAGSADRPGYNSGLCRSLTESAYINVLYFNDKATSWTDSEADRFGNERIDPAVRYLETQKNAYGYGAADLLWNYDEAAYTSNGAETVTYYYDGIIANNKPSEWVDYVAIAARQLGYAGADEYVKARQEATGIRQQLFLICVNGGGRSHSMRSDMRSQTIPDEEEYAVIFASREDSGATFPSIVAREILYNFGAEYQFARDGNWTNRQALANQLHKYEVMLTPLWNIEDNVIGAYTAFAVGWRNDMPQEYDRAEWWS